MRQTRKRPPADANGGAVVVVSSAGCGLDHHTDRLAFRLEPGGDAVTEREREAQTPALLVRAGGRGFTAGDAAPLGGVRRTSSYVHRLRLAGVLIPTSWERAGGARIGRYRLAAPVTLLTGGEGLL